VAAPEIRLAEAIVKYIATHLERESRFLSPNPEAYLTDPYGLLDLIRDHGIAPAQIDAWLVQAQAEGE
jgi:hypothetical protein